MLAWQHNREARTEGRHGAIVRSRPIIRVPRGRALMKRRILVVDIGGTFVKLLMSERVEREFPSGPRVTPKQFLAKLKETARGWKFDVASIGFPAPVRNGRILRNPKHLGKDWVHFNFARALGIPVRIVNDAAMQALGSYLGGGRMLFLGLGTGLGSALVWGRNLMSLELGDLPYANENIIENDLGVPGLAKLGKRKQTAATFTGFKKIPSERSVYRKWA